MKLLNTENSVPFEHDGRKFRVGLVPVSPAQAEEILKTMAHNRPAKPSNVEAIAAAISNDKFVVNGQALIFDGSGTLMDGQHRVMAILKAQKPVVTFVIEGVSPNARTTLDSFARSFKDVLIAEFGVPSEQATICASATNISYALRYHGNLEHGSYPFRALAIDHFRSEREVLEPMVSDAVDKFEIRVLNIGILVALYLEFSHFNTDVGRQFFVTLCGNSHDVPAFVALRERLIADGKKHRGKMSKASKIRLCIEAFNAALEGNPAPNLTVRKKSPLPKIGGEIDNSSEGSNSAAA